MPSPKTGTVTFEIGHIVSELRKGRVDFRMDKDANVQIPVGKASFDPAQVADNLEAAIAAVVSAKPPTAKGIYIKAMSVCLTMSPSVQLNLNRALQQVKTAA